MRLCAVLMLAGLALSPPRALGSLGDQEAAAAILAEARALVRSGLLSEAAAALATLPTGADAELQGHAQILLGNVSYERGRFEEALERYQFAISSLERATAAGNGQLEGVLKTVRDNAELARTQVDRRHALSRSSMQLRAALAAILLSAVVTVLLLARRTRGLEPAG